MRVRVSLGICVTVCLAGWAALWPSQDPVDKTLRRYESARVRLATAINEVREEEGLGPLSVEPLLTRAAQEVALAIAERLKAEEAFEQAAVRDGELEERMAAAGFDTHSFAVRFAVLGGEAPEVAARLTAGGHELRRTDLPQIGIGIAPSFRSRIYVVVAALSAGDHFASETAELDDLQAVRLQLLDRINQARLESDGGVLKLDACLSRVAQARARSLLAEGFVGHTESGGGDLDERVHSEGCPHGGPAEALASGQTSVGEVVAEWLTVPEYRRMLLEPEADSAGLGLAMGRGPDGYTTVWVQVLAASGPAIP